MTVAGVTVTSSELHMVKIWGIATVACGLWQVGLLQVSWLASAVQALGRVMQVFSASTSTWRHRVCWPEGRHWERMSGLHARELPAYSPSTLAVPPQDMLSDPPDSFATGGCPHASALSDTSGGGSTQGTLGVCDKQCHRVGGSSWQLCIGQGQGGVYA
jgi:hypothetical protein